MRLYCKIGDEMGTMMSIQTGTGITWERAPSRCQVRRDYGKATGDGDRAGCEVQRKEVTILMGSSQKRCQGYLKVVKIQGKSL